MEKCVLSQDGKLISYTRDNLFFGLTTTRYGDFKFRNGDGDACQKNLQHLSLHTENDCCVQLLPNHDPHAIINYQAPAKGIKRIEADSLFYTDNKNRTVLGLIHCSHMTLAGHIIELTLFDVLLATYLYIPFSDLKAVIYTGICPDCYEVGPEIYMQYIEYPYLLGYFKVGNGDRFQLDLSGLIQGKLIHLGIEAENITTIDICSQHDTFGDFLHDENSDPLLFSLRQRQEKERNLVFCSSNNLMIASTTGNCPYVAIYS